MKFSKYGCFFPTFWFKIVRCGIVAIYTIVASPFFNCLSNETWWINEVHYHENHSELTLSLVTKRQKTKFTAGQNLWPAPLVKLVLKICTTCYLFIYLEFYIYLYIFEQLVCKLIIFLNCKRVLLSKLLLQYLNNA